jgi:hypothetical protein
VNTTINENNTSDRIVAGFAGMVCRVDVDKLLRHPRMYIYTMSSNMTDISDALRDG